MVNHGHLYHIFTSINSSLKLIFQATFIRDVTFKVIHYHVLSV